MKMWAENVNFGYLLVVDSDIEAACEFWCEICAIRALTDSDFFGCLQTLAKWFLVPITIETGFSPDRGCSRT